MLMTLSVLEGHSPVASLFKLHLCATWWESRSASRGSFRDSQVSDFH